MSDKKWKYFEPEPQLFWQHHMITSYESKLSSAKFANVNAKALLLPVSKLIVKPIYI